MKGILNGRAAKAAFTRNIRYLMLALIIVLLIVVFSLIMPNFLRLDNIMNIIRQTSVLAIIAIGMTFIILTGGIDLSVGSNIAFAGAIAAIVLVNTGSIPLSLLSAILGAAAIGALNGVMIGYSSISAFMATLATMTLARGLALSLTGAKSIRMDNPQLIWLGQTSWGPIPVVVFLVLILYLLFHKILRDTVWGKYVYAVGGNLTAARATGVRTGGIVMSTYVICGLTVGIGTIITIGRLSSAQPWAGLGLEFEVITAVVLGGTSLKGGEGNLKGTILGTILVGVLANGLGLMDISPFTLYLVKGGMILAAVIIDQVGQLYPKTARRGETAKGERGKAVVEEAGLSAQAFKSLEMQRISKAFPGVQALSEVDFSISSGEVHAIVGENGAGKSTLMKILAGAYSKDAGRILINGAEVNIDSPHKSQTLGISVIYQEFSLISQLNVGQNIYLGKEIPGRLKMFVSWGKMYRQARELLNRFNLNIEVRKPIKELTVGEQQMVEIAKALNSKAKIIVMDEPTSALTEDEKGTLFSIIKRLKQEGVGVVYISHRMPEIFEIADSVTVLRDGRLVGTSAVSKVTEKELIRMMVGRELGDIFSRKRAAVGRKILEVKDLTRAGVFEHISFEVREGEVVGLSGLMGAGRTEIARCIFGLDRYDSGEVFLEDKKLRIQHPIDAIREGIIYVTEDRRREGIIPMISVKENLALPSYPWINVLGLINKKKELEISDKYIGFLRIKTPSDKQYAINLSGGNQQKVSLGKWLARNPKLLILDEPTRGIDVGAKSEIHSLIEQLAFNKIAILLISSELPEVLGVCDRIIVLHEGRITGHFTGQEATQEKIMLSATAVGE
jgi:ribose transport system ATP-binding protein